MDIIESEECHAFIACLTQIKNQLETASLEEMKEMDKNDDKGSVGAMAKYLQIIGCENSNLDAFMGKEIVIDTYILMIYALSSKNTEAIIWCINNIQPTEMILEIFGYSIDILNEAEVTEVFEAMLEMDDAKKWWVSLYENSELHPELFDSYCPHDQDSLDDYSFTESSEDEE